MNIIITGGAGFIGSNFVKFCIDSNKYKEIAVIDNLSEIGTRYRSDSLHNYATQQNFKNIRFIHEDLANLNAYSPLLSNFDIIVHFGANTHVDTSLKGMSNEIKFIENNLIGTIKLLYFAKQNGIKRFHHISTDEVFGELSLDTNRKFTETSEYCPKNPYSVSKAASDFSVRNFANRFDIYTTISNCSNNFGKYQTPEKMIPRSIALLQNKKKIKLYTDSNGVPGKNIRDWLHVTDHCIAIDKILENGISGETYCIGADNELTNLQLINILLKTVSKMSITEMPFDDYVELVTDRPSHDLRYAINFSKIQKELDWNPIVTQTKGLENVIHWYFSDEGKAWLNATLNATEDVRENQSKIIKESK